MIDYIKRNHLSLLIIVFLIVSGISSSNQNLGSISRDATKITNPFTFEQGIRVGTVSTNRSLVSGLQFGTCTLTGLNISHAASTTKPYDCAVTGAVSGDMVLMQFATSTPGSLAQAGWAITGAKASTTDGYITADILNLTGGDSVPSASRQIASTTSYIIFR